MCPVMSGSLSPTMLSRITERPPSAPHQRRTLQHFTVRGIDEDFAVLGLEARDARAGAQLDQPRQRLAAVEERAVDVGAVRSRRKGCRSGGRSARRAAMSTTRSALTPSIMSSRSMKTASFFTRPPTPSASSACQALGRAGMPAPISPKLRRLLEHHRTEALARERQRRGEPADAAAGDDDRPIVASCVSRLHCSMLSAVRAERPRTGSASVSMISKWLRPFPTRAAVSLSATFNAEANSRDWR
jgi:hypothetical protein